MLLLRYKSLIIYMFENTPFPKNDFVDKHDERYPKNEIDSQFEQLVLREGMDVVDVTSATARLITRMEPMKPEIFNMIVDEYIDFRIKNKEFDKALYYSYSVLVDCMKDAGNLEKQGRKNKILDYIALCAQEMKNKDKE